MGAVRVKGGTNLDSSCVLFGVHQHKPMIMVSCSFGGIEFFQDLQRISKNLQSTFI